MSTGKPKHNAGILFSYFTHWLLCGRNARHTDKSRCQDDQQKQKRVLLGLLHGIDAVADDDVIILAEEHLAAYEVALNSKLSSGHMGLLIFT